MNTRTITAENLTKFLETVSKDARLIAPTRDGERVCFAPVEAVADIVPHTDYVNTRNSIKEFFFPPTEPLLAFERNERGFDLAEPPLGVPPTVIFGCRPCDATSLTVMDPLYDWDYRDGFWFARRAATTVVAISCVRADESCFCTAVGGAPNSTTGSDILLTPLDEERFLAEILTEKGEALAAKAPDLFADGQGDKDEACKAALEVLPPALDLDKITAWLAENFENDRWAELSWKCLGCGCCTFLCPTCHCFDIVDEGGYRTGVRRRNWDGCQFAWFTLHASGHNPRPDQAARWRQRVQHKFNYYVQKFGLRSCVGCGRCIRHCPVNMNIFAQLREFAARFGAASQRTK